MSDDMTGAGFIPSQGWWWARRKDSDYGFTTPQVVWVDKYASVWVTGSALAWPPDAFTDWKQVQS